MCHLKTLIICIGNSDNKLTQLEWAAFCDVVGRAVRHEVVKIHFKGGTNYDSQYQTACWVCEIPEENIATLRDHLTSIRINYNQDSIAIVIGDTEFV